MILEEKTYVDKAERVIAELANNKDKWGNVNMVTISQVRNLLSMTADIYNEVKEQGENLSDEMNAKIDYLRVRYIYESGRDGNEQVKKFVEKAQILEALQQINGSKKNYILFMHYIEALVAFHKYNGGKN